MKTIEARIDDRVDDLITSLNALVGELALEALARKTRRTPRREVKRRSPAQPRREPEEDAVLAENLYGQICKHPGETMVTLSRHMNVPAKDLSLPACKLAKAGRIKKAGQRQFTRYFPIGQEAKRKPASRRRAR
jgi:hypothetical protein